MYFYLHKRQNTHATMQHLSKWCVLLFTALNDFEGLVITASSDVEMVWILLIILPANELDYSKHFLNRCKHELVHHSATNME